MLRRVALGVSGGVDSAVSALILKKQGFEVIGVFMRNWDTVNEKGICQPDIDLQDAEFVCKKLNIPLHEVNFVKEYWNQVFSEMLFEYENGRTPNPDILCNKYLKFNMFLKYALEKLNCDAIATGHYARTDVGFDLHLVDKKKGHLRGKLKTNDGVKLLTAEDVLKDQTFFLSQIKQSALQKTIFPVGEINKTFVRKMAVAAGLEHIVQKKESMGICFIGSRNFQSFIEEYIEQKKGNFIDIVTGKIVGEHKGWYSFHYWTIGQRACIGGIDKRYFVADFKISTNDILVAPGTKHPSLFYQTIFTEQPHWIRAPPVHLYKDQMFDCDFRYQHSHPVIKCTCTLTGGNGLIVSLERPMRALCVGQFAVFYDKEECLGSARIIRRGPSLFTLNYKDYMDLPHEFT
ncbi:hypothetical protein LOTGIDRAFT_200906 [Lottia gigantea]|uniref:tRNA-5-taurinomethyluridine 2-sulfurtransferase n=1 Tax=Lottia gigantea TaxID=225164 RepID=V4B1V2_LOTGI|nr:hypothetical protein LOTGIDRAFT_200906 [Lottia gigantea]ESP00322.1 hypothetical protein LOTGIDRAFT_200906 [Lottia gigantea]